MNGFEVGDRIEAKRCAGLSVRWEAGALLELIGRSWRVRFDRGGAEMLLTPALVRKPKGMGRVEAPLTGPLTPKRETPVLTRTPSYERRDGIALAKERALRCDLYLAHVRKYPCAVCARTGPSDPHHFGPRGMGQKTDDFRVVPLCRSCHDDFHQRGTVSSLSRVETEHLFYRAQIDALVEWLREAVR